MRNTRLAAAAAVLSVAQLVHGLVPTEGEVDGGGGVGLVGGTVLLLLSIAAAVGAATGARWSRRLALAVGLLVSVGFVLYHAIPVQSPVTNPYPGEPVGVPAWLTVAVAVAAGAWCAYEASAAARRSAPVAP